MFSGENFFIAACLSKCRKIKYTIKFKQDEISERNFADLPFEKMNFCSPIVIFHYQPGIIVAVFMSESNCCSWLLSTSIAVQTRRALAAGQFYFFPLFKLISPSQYLIKWNRYLTCLSHAQKKLVYHYF